MSLVPLWRRNVPAMKSGVPAVRSRDDLEPVTAKYRDGTRVPVAFPAQTAPNFSQPSETYVSGFALRRYEASVSESVIPGQAGNETETDAIPDAVVAFGRHEDRADHLALVLARGTSGGSYWNESFFRSGEGRTVHPAGFEILVCKTIKIPRPIMRELVNRPADPRELFVLAAVVVAASDVRLSNPEFMMSWACAPTAADAVKRWQSAERGLRGLAAKGQRAAVVTALLMPRSQMEWTMCFPPIEDE